MNKFCGVGRLCADPEIRTMNNDKQTTVARFRIAISRKYKNAEGKYDADFITCNAFGATADFIEKYFHKGMAIGITGSVQTGSYTNKDGATVYTTEIHVDDVEFVESKNASDNGGSQKNADFVNVPPTANEALPFN